MSYSCDVKILRGAQDEIESDIEAYLSTVTSGKVFFVDVTSYGVDQLLVLIVHDA